MDMLTAIVIAWFTSLKLGKFLCFPPLQFLMSVRVIRTVKSH